MDHNRLKNITLDKAASLGVATQRFPIGQHLQLKSSAILSINHSFEILARVYNGESFEKACREAIPERKVAAPAEMSGKPDVMAKSEEMTEMIEND